MYTYTDISRLIRNINSNTDSFYVSVDDNTLNSELDTLRLFIAEHSFDNDVKAIFEVIDFLKVRHGFDRELNNIYMMIGRVSQKVFYEDRDNIYILEGYMQLYISQAYRAILNNNNPTLKDIFDLYGIIPVPINEENKQRVNTNK